MSLTNMRQHRVFLYDAELRHEAGFHDDGHQMFRTAFDVPHYAWRRVVEMYRLARKSMPRVDAKYLVVSMLQAGCSSKTVDAQRAAVVAS
jgi:hypothetical protein